MTILRSDGGLQLNLLARLNRELGRTSIWKPLRTGDWNPVESRIEMHLESRIANRAAGRAGLEVDFAAVRASILRTATSIGRTGRGFA